MSSLSPTVQAAVVALQNLPSGPNVHGYVPNLRELILEQLMSSLARESDEVLKVAVAVLSCTDKERYADWKDKLEGGAAMSDDVHDESIAEKGLDLLVLTVKKVEFLACLQAFNVSNVDPDIRLGEDCDLWLAEIDGLNVGIGVIGSDGNVEAAIEVNRIASQIRFSAAVLVGMAAGLQSEVKKGDVVVSSWVAAYDFVRATPTEYVSRAKLYPGDSRAWQRMAQLEPSRLAWAEKIRREVESCKVFGGIEDGEEEKLEDWRPNFKPGVILAGSRLIEDDSIKDLKSQVNDRAIAAEMEGAGFAAACTAMRVPWLVIRGIADYGKGDVGLAVAADDYPIEVAESLKRGKSWQFPATFAAAAFVRDMILGAKIPLVPDIRNKIR